MTAILEHLHGPIVEIYRTHGVRRLDLFGSGAKGTFDSATSDFDFLVDLGEYEATVATRYFDFVEALRGLVDREIDVVTVRAKGNPAMLEEIEATRQTIYAS